MMRTPLRSTFSTGYPADAYKAGRSARLVDEPILDGGSDLGREPQIVPPGDPALHAAHQEHAPDLAGATAREPAPMRVLAYVHLRNIHGSTGAGRVARQLCEHLALRGDIDLRILADAADRERILPLVGTPWDQFRYSTFPADTSRQQARWMLLNNPVAERYWPEAQVAWLTAESYVPVRTARLVVTLHDAAYFERGDRAHRPDAAYWRQRFKWQLLYRRLARRADLFHTVSEFSAERLAHYFPAIRDRLRVVPNAVSPVFFAPVEPEGQDYLEAQGFAAASAARQPDGASQQRQESTGRDGQGRRPAPAPLVLVPGGLHFRKNAELILAAAPVLLRQFPALTIAVVNHSDPEYAARAQALGPRFRLLGFVTDAALRALYGAAAAVWFPSRYEGFGLPVVEAMACGAPVVASQASSLPEIAGGAALLVPDGAALPGHVQGSAQSQASSIAAHVDAVAFVLSDERAAAQLSHLGRARAAEFTWGRSAALIAEHFRSLL